MSQRAVRARDVDRDAAIEIVEAAWADGQLTRDEYEQRTDRLLRAPALQDLEKEIVDLQPEGTEWRPATAASEPAAISTPSRAPVYLAAAMTTIVIAGLIVLSNRGSDSTPPQAAAAPVTSASLLTPAAFSLARDELTSRTGSDAVYSAVLTDKTIEFVHPTSAAGSDAVEITWDGQWGTERVTSGSGERLSLGLVNAGSVSAMVDRAHRQAGSDAEVALRFGIERRGDQRVCITVTAGTTWTRGYDCQGREVGN